MEKRKEDAIMVALTGFTENFRKETTKELVHLWLTSLGDLSMEAILKGTRRCLTECEFYPTIKIFREKALTGTTERGGQWKDAPQIEHKSDRVNMPADFIKKLMAGAQEKGWKNRGLNAMPHEGEENGSKFRITRDARGRDHVFFYGRGMIDPEL
jgi:hypothetical protein